MIGLVSCMSRAGRAILEIRSQENFEAIEKSGISDVVTAGDHEAERIVTDWLVNYHSEDGIQAEEGTTRPSRSGKIWYPDPIDGTTNYSRGAPFFGISVGRADEAGIPDCGAIHFAAEGWSVWAVRGSNRGTQCDDLRISPTDRLVAPKGADALRGALVGVGLTRGYEYLYEVLKAKTRNVVMLGSVTYEALLVARGFWDAYVHTAATQFDVAAATVICREAGCTVTSMHSDEVNLNEKKIPFMVTRSPRLTEELRRVIIENRRVDS